jgi:hypothetical protein
MLDPTKPHTPPVAGGAPTAGGLAGDCAGGLAAAEADAVAEVADGVVTPGAPAPGGVAVGAA